MKKGDFEYIDRDISIIETLNAKHSGHISYNDQSTMSEMEKVNGTYLLRINDILDFDPDEIQFDFLSEGLHLNIAATIKAHRNTVNLKEKWARRYSEGKIYSFRSKQFVKDQPYYLRSYFKVETNKQFYNYFGIKSYLPLLVNNYPLQVHWHGDYVLIESNHKIDYDTFSEICYNIQVAIGFITGKFIQDEVYTFQYKDKLKSSLLGFEYRELRRSSFSMYHALVKNPYGYQYFIGKDNAEQLYKNDTLKHFDASSLSQLVELIHNNSQVQYALVLFNEANSNKLSLLIKNNCFYAVLEVLRKYFYDRFQSTLPMEYSRVGNIEKYKMIFGSIISLTAEEMKMLKHRNVFLHGDIKDIESQGMVDIMQQQITLIYRLILTHVGFEGYIIDHYSMRNNLPDKSFVKVN